MGLSLGKFSRTITISGFSADADPNVSAPLASRIFRPEIWSASGDHTKGHMLVGAFNNNAETGTVSFTTWLRDETDGSWYKFDADTLAHREIKVQPDCGPAAVFVQVTAFNGIAVATSFTLKATEI